MGSVRRRGHKGAKNHGSAHAHRRHRLERRRGVCAPPRLFAAAQTGSGAAAGDAVSVARCRGVAARCRDARRHVFCAAWQRRRAVAGHGERNLATRESDDDKR